MSQWSVSNEYESLSHRKWECNCVRHEHREKRSKEPQHFTRIEFGWLKGVDPPGRRTYRLWNMEQSPTNLFQH